MTGLVNKAFGSLSYEMELSKYKESYQTSSLESSLQFTERE